MKGIVVGKTRIADFQKHHVAVLEQHIEPPAPVVAVRKRSGEQQWGVGHEGERVSPEVAGRLVFAGHHHS